MISMNTYKILKLHVNSDKSASLDKTRASCARHGYPVVIFAPPGLHSGAVRRAGGTQLISAATG